MTRTHPSGLLRQRELGLVEAVTRGRPDEDDDHGAGFSSWANDHWGQLTRIGYGLTGDWHEAEDLTQETLIRLHAAWPIRNKECLPGYARRMIINRFIDSRRRPRPTAMPELPEPALVHMCARPARGLWGEPASDQAERFCSQAVLLQAVRHLSPKMRTVIVLRYYYELPTAEVAAALGCSVGNVKSQASRGLNVLRRLMSEGGEDAG